MMTIVGFFLGPVGRWVGIVGVAAMVIAGIYGKGRVDGAASYKAKIERQINESIKGGTEARQRAADELNAGRVPDHWLRD